MDGRSYILSLLLLVVLFVFSFVLFTIALAEGIVFLGILSIIGFIVALVVSVVQSITVANEGMSIGLWFYVYIGITEIIFIWFLTRAGTMLGLW
jgi:hypothetical protein